MKKVAKYLSMCLIMAVAFVFGSSVSKAEEMDLMTLKSADLHLYGEGQYTGGAVSDLKQVAATKTSVTIQWNPVEGAVGYYISESDGYTETPLTGEPINATQFTMQYPQDTARLMGVYPVDANGNIGYPGAVLVRTTPSKVSGVQYYKVFAKTNKLSVGWNQNALADGYEAICYNAKGKKVQKKTVTNVNYVEFSKTNTSNIYYVVVRAYITLDNGITLYGDKSSKFYAVPQPPYTSSNADVKRNSFNFKWKKVKGATSYTIYASKQADSGYKKIATVKTNSYKFTKFNGSTIDTLNNPYYLKVVVNGKVKKKKVKSDKYYYTIIQTYYR